MTGEIVTVATFSNQGEAQIARGFLESCGIEVFVRDENMSRMENPVLIGGSKLQVSAADAAKARELLAQVNRQPGQ
jgi:Putative prokaryotic signal transducing protein